MPICLSKVIINKSGEFKLHEPFRSLIMGCRRRSKSGGVSIGMGTSMPVILLRLLRQHPLGSLPGNAFDMHHSAAVIPAIAVPTVPPTVVAPPVLQQGGSVSLDPLQLSAYSMLASSIVSLRMQRLASAIQKLLLDYSNPPPQNMDMIIRHNGSWLPKVCRAG